MVNKKCHPHYLPVLPRFHQTLSYVFELYDFEKTEIFCTFWDSHQVRKAHDSWDHLSGSYACDREVPDKVT